MCDVHRRTRARIVILACTAARLFLRRRLTKSQLSLLWSLYYNQVKTLRLGLEQYILLLAVAYYSDNTYAQRQPWKHQISQYYAHHYYTAVWYKYLTDVMQNTTSLYVRTPQFAGLCVTEDTAILRRLGIGQGVRDDLGFAGEGDFHALFLGPFILNAG